LQHYSTVIGLSRAYGSATSLRSRTSGHVGYDAVEHALGLARTFRIEVDRDAPVGEIVEALRCVHEVEHATPHYLATTPFAVGEAAPIDEASAWAQRDRIGWPEAMAYEPGDPAVIVAIVDTGADPDHPELRNRLRHGRGTVALDPTDLPPGLRLLSVVGDDGTDDAVGHGTSCATIIGGAGSEIPPGLAGACGPLPIRVLGAAVFPGKHEPVGVGAIADIDSGVKLAIDLGARVLNMSFGTPESELAPGEPLPHADVVAYGRARGCVMVAASGNSGLAERFSPAALDGVIAVGAIGADGMPTAFSTRGDHVALCAPGERVVTADLHGYSQVTGTSFASPFVAAGAALLVSRAERRGIPVDGTLIARVLRDSATPWPRDERYRGHGAGVLNAHAALELLDQQLDAQRSDRMVRSEGGSRAT
jgi:subtilisin family serine protease